MYEKIILKDNLDNHYIVQSHISHVLHENIKIKNFFDAESAELFLRQLITPNNYWAQLLCDAEITTHKILVVDDVIRIASTAIVSGRLKVYSVKLKKYENYISLV